MLLSTGACEPEPREAERVNETTAAVARPAGGDGGRPPLGLNALLRRPASVADLAVEAVPAGLVQAILREHLAEGSLSVEALARAAVTVSDNTAANLLLAKLGGPEALTQFVRSLGDATTRLDRYEPELNDYRAGDERDTTTPLTLNNE